MKFLFSTGSLYTYGMERCFQLAARAGFDGVELMVDGRWDTRQPAYLRTIMERHELPILAVHSPFRNVHGWTGGQPGLIAHAVRLAEDVGAQVVIHHLPQRLGYAMLAVGGRRVRVPTPGLGAEKEYRRWLLEGYTHLQAKTDVALCIENMPARRFWGRRLNGHYWNTVDEIQRFPTLTMDTTHLGTWGLDPVTVYDAWGERVRHIHLSNFDGYEHRLPDAGHLRLDRLLARLTRDGYDGLITFELHPDAARAGASDGKIVRALAKSLANCRAWVETAAADQVPANADAEAKDR
jgi:sugar phosphate isomerase/epimerase